MKLAHLVIAHHNPQMLERLVKRLKHPDADIFIQLDKKTNIIGFKYIEEQGYATFITDRVNIRPGSYSFVEAIMNGFGEILKNGENYSHINVLSSQDYPLKPIRDIHEFLFANADKTYMYAPEIPHQWQEGQVRLSNYSLRDIELPFRSKVERLVNTILPDRKMPYQLIPYGFSPWFTITPVSAQYVIGVVAQKPGLKRFFRYTRGIDEMFFQTILMNSALRKNIISNNLRYIEKDSAGRQVILTSGDSDKLLSSGKLFARKFDAGISNDILNYLDDTICEKKDKIDTAY